MSLLKKLSAFGGK